MKNQLSITDAERLILANQYKILAQLDRQNDGHEHEDYERLSKALMHGHSWLYQSYFDQVLADNLSDETEDYVVEVLALFSILKDSYTNLPQEEMCLIDPRNINFIGFDGNNESDLLSFARALRENGRFTEILKDGCQNSHCPTGRVYGNMLGAWKVLGKPNYPLTVEHIKAIADSRWAE